ncbi:hypothetical protein Tco_0500781 [Tanacetum coccineum]
MCTYLKNMAGWKPKDLKTKSCANVQELFDKAMKRVNRIVDMDTELVGDHGDDVTIEATPLSTKSPTIMLKNFDREDLEFLWSIVKARVKKTEPVNYMDIFLHLNLKTMFEHHLEDSAGSDLGKTPESRPSPEHVLMEEDQAGSNPGQSHVAQAGPNPH